MIDEVKVENVQIGDVINDTRWKYAMKVGHITKGRKYYSFLYEYVPALGYEYEVVWKLCEKCCEFACDVIECVSNLDNEQERETWIL